MRLGRILPALAALPLALGGCGILGGSSSTPTATASSAAGAGGGQPWVVVKPGSPTATTGAPLSGSYPPALPPVSFLATESAAACTTAWPDYVGMVMIPLVVTPGSRSIKVTWPNRYGNTYRVTAVPQSLVTGAQPQPAWQTVTTGAACEGTATISGLVTGEAYIVWLDAPNTPRDAAGTRSLYTGRSGVVKPN